MKSARLHLKERRERMEWRLTMILRSSKFLTRYYRMYTDFVKLITLQFENLQNLIQLLFLFFNVLGGCDVLGVEMMGVKRFMFLKNILTSLFNK